MLTSSDEDLFDIVAEEFVLRLRNGESPAIQEFARLYPAISNEIRELFPAIWLVEAGACGQTRSRAFVSARPAHDFPGTKRFEVIRRLGSGGMGVVYEAHDHETNMRVALKSLLSFNPAALIRFKREFRLLTDLVHPNLVSLYELHSDGHNWFFTMELIDGSNFHDWLRAPSVAPEFAGCAAVHACNQSSSAADRRSSALPHEQQLREAFRQLAIAIQFLHSHGRLHRDIKFSNVMVRRDGAIVLLDFGLVSLQQKYRIFNRTPTLSLVRTTDSELTIAGSALFMAPEQAAGCSLTPACDWYAFGVMLYQSLIARLPFLGSPLEVMLRKQSEDPVPPQELVEGLPLDLCELCVKLLRRPADQRPSAEEVIRVLEGTFRSVDDQPASNMVPDPQRNTCSMPTEIDAAEATAEPLFVGRQQPLTELFTAFDKMAAGQAVLVSVHGASGLGKTALVQKFLKDIVSRNVGTVLRGNCHERELVPFKAIDALMDDLYALLSRMSSQDVQQLLPPGISLLCRAFPVLNRACSAGDRACDELSGAEPAELRRRAFNALWELFKRLACRRPLVLAIDDLHWADEDSVAVLSDLLSMRDPPQLLLVVTSRAESASTLLRLREHVSRNSSRRDSFVNIDIELQPLSQEEARELAFRHFTQALIPGSRAQTFDNDTTHENLGERNGRTHSPHSESRRLTEAGCLEAEKRQTAIALTDAIALESGGHPYFVQELVRYASTRNFRVPANATFGILDLDEALWLRVVDLPDEARRLVEIAAVSGKPLRLDVARAAGRVSDPTGRAISRLRYEHLLRTSGPTAQDNLEPFHDRVRESVLSHLTSDVQRTLHARLANALEQIGDFEPEALAWHLKQADQPLRAGHYYALAADAAARSLAFERAANLYRLSFELQLPDNPDRLQLQRRLADALADAGRGGDAAREYISAASCGSHQESIILRRRAARQFCISGHTDEGRRLFREVLREQGISMRSHRWTIIGSLLWQRLRLRLRGCRYTVSAAEEVNGQLIELIDLLWDAASGLAFQEPVVVASLHTRGLLLALKAGEPRRLVRALSWEAAFSATAGTRSSRRVESLMRGALCVAESLNDPYSAAMLRLGQGMAAFLCVRMPQALPALIEAEKIFATSPSKAWLELAAARSMIVWALMHMGDYRRLESCVSAYTQEAQSRRDRFLLSSIGSAGQPQLLLAADRVDDAARELREVIDRYPCETFQQQHVSILYSQAHIDLYRGDAKSAWQRICHNWPCLRRSLQLRNQFARVSMLELKARSALQIAMQGRSPKMLTEARRIFAQMQRESGQWVRPYASRLRAGIAEMESDQQTAVIELEAARTGFDSIGFQICAAYAKRRIGQLLGANEGERLVKIAEEVLSSQGIRNPDRFQAICLY
jgi:serine/threonine protein kinase